MSYRAARAAEQSDPNSNPYFRRWWGDGGATGPDAERIRSWHASDLPAPPMTRARLEAEMNWRQVTRRAAP